MWEAFCRAVAVVRGLDGCSVGRLWYRLQPFSIAYGVLFRTCLVSSKLQHAVCELYQIFIHHLVNVDLIYQGR